MKEELYVTTLLTCSLKNVFKIFKAEHIKEISAMSAIIEEIDTTSDPLLGLEICKKTDNVIKINYSDVASPKLTDKEVNKMFNLMSEAGLSDAIVKWLTIELHPNIKKWQQIIPYKKIEEKIYIATFRNEICPTPLKDTVKNKNQELYFSGNKQFRYRQLLLNYLVGNSQLGTIPYAKRVPIIELNPKWTRKKTELPKWGDYKLIKAISNDLGEYASIQKYRLDMNKEWKYVG